MSRTGRSSRKQQSKPYPARPRMHAARKAVAFRIRKANRAEAQETDKMNAIAPAVLVRLPLGQITITALAIETLTARARADIPLPEKATDEERAIYERAAGLDAHAVVQRVLRRHATGDWGNLAAEDREANDTAVRNGERVLSAYELTGPDKLRIWVITEADRQQTTVLLPEEY